MKVVGVFRELGRGMSESLPSIFSALGLLPQDDVSTIVSFLESGITVFDVMEAVIDPIDQSTVISGGSSLITDGVWVWRYDLKYYVEKYRVELPQEFIDYVRASGKVELVASDIVVRWQEVFDTYDAFKAPRL
jgi:hypothetical protein